MAEEKKSDKGKKEKQEKAKQILSNLGSDEEEV